LVEFSCCSVNSLSCSWLKLVGLLLLRGIICDFGQYELVLFPVFLLCSVLPCSKLMKFVFVVAMQVEVMIFSALK
jgi:hypothetical protein